MSGYDIATGLDHTWDALGPARGTRCAPPIGPGYVPRYGPPMPRLGWTLGDPLGMDPREPTYRTDPGTRPRTYPRHPRRLTLCIILYSPATPMYACMQGIYVPSCKRWNLYPGKYPTIAHRRLIERS